MKRIAAVFLHELALEAVFSSPDPEAPRAVFTERRGKVVLHAVSAGARRHGIRRGMSRSEARAMLRSLDVRPRRDAIETVVLARAAEIGFTFGPVVEIAPPDLLFIDVSHTPGLEADDTTAEAALAERIVQTFNQAGHVVRVVIASTPSTARTVVQWPKALPRTKKRKKASLPSFEVVRPEQEQDRLDSLPITALTWTDKRRDPDGTLKENLRQAESSLAVLGVRDGRRLKALPAEQLANRFGVAGALLASRVRGTEQRPLAPFKPPEHLSDDVEFDHPTEALMPILGEVERLLQRLALRLEARSRAVSKVQLVFRVEPSMDHEIRHDAPRSASSQWDETLVLRFARPTRKAKTLVSLARETLGQSLPGLVRSVRVEAHAPDLDLGAQLDLFNQHARRTEDVAELISRLQASLGPDAVFRPVIANTHRPETAWTRAPFDIEKALAEPKHEKPKPVVHTAIVGTLERKQPSAPLPKVDQNLGVTAPLFTGIVEPGAKQLKMGGPGSARTGPHCSQAEGAQGAKQLKMGGPGSARTGPHCSQAEGAQGAKQLKMGGPGSARTGPHCPSWPKPLPRQPEDEPLAPLPSRPLTLLDPPERAGLTQGSSVDEGVLHWRRERLPLVSMSAREQLDTEWWAQHPLVREYRIAETAEGRRFWVYFDACGELFVHGIFD